MKVLIDVNYQNPPAFTIWGPTTGRLVEKDIYLFLLLVPIVYPPLQLTERLQTENFGLCPKTFSFPNNTVRWFALLKCFSDSVKSASVNKKGRGFRWCGIVTKPTNSKKVANNAWNHLIKPQLMGRVETAVMNRSVTGCLLMCISIISWVHEWAEGVIKERTDRFEESEAVMKSQNACPSKGWHNRAH